MDGRALLGLLVVVKVLDVGFYTAFDRPFNPFDDWRHGSDGIQTLHASIGETMANLVLDGLHGTTRIPPSPLMY